MPGSFLTGFLDGAMGSVNNTINNEAKENQDVDEYRKKSLIELDLNSELNNRKLDKEAEINKQKQTDLQNQANSSIAAAYKNFGPAFNTPSQQSQTSQNAPSSSISVSDLPPQSGGDVSSIPSPGQPNSAGGQPTVNGDLLSTFGVTSSQQPAIGTSGKPATSMMPNGQPDNTAYATSSETGMPIGGGQNIQPNHFSNAMQLSAVKASLENSGVAASNPYVKAHTEALDTQIKAELEMHKEEQAEMEKNSKPLEGPDKQAVAEYGEKRYTDLTKNNPNTQYNPISNGQPLEIPRTSAHDDNRPGDGDAGQQDKHVHDTIFSPLLQASAASLKGNGTSNIQTVTSSIADEVQHQTNNILTITSNNKAVTQPDKLKASSELTDFFTKTFGDKNQLNARLQSDDNLKQVVNSIKTLSKGQSSDTAKAQPQITEGATATNQKTGEKVIYKNGQWEPLTTNQ